MAGKFWLLAAFFAAAISLRAQMPVLGYTYVHDPSRIIKQGTNYFVFYTDQGIGVNTSTLDFVILTPAQLRLRHVPLRSENQWPEGHPLLFVRPVAKWLLFREPAYAVLVGLARPQGHLETLPYRHVRKALSIDDHSLARLVRILLLNLRLHLILCNVDAVDFVHDEELSHFAQY